MRQGILLCVLGFLAAEDIRKKQISVKVMGVSGFVGLVLHFLHMDGSVWSLFLGVLLGIVLVMLSLLTQESIGLGDGILFAVTGVYLGGAGNMELLFVSLLYAALFSLALLLLGKKKRKQEIPFVPFVFVGYITILLEALL